MKEIKSNPFDSCPAYETKSLYEKEPVFLEIIGLAATKLADDFEVDQIMVKATPAEAEKVDALICHQFRPYKPVSFPFDHYYLWTNRSAEW